MAHDTADINLKLGKLKVDLMNLAEMHQSSNMRLNEKLVKDLIEILKKHFEVQTDVTSAFVKDTDLLLDDAVKVVVDSFAKEASPYAHKLIADVKKDLNAIQKIIFKVTSSSSSDKGATIRAKLNKIIHQSNFNAEVLLREINHYDRSTQIKMLSMIMDDDGLFRTVVLGQNAKDVRRFCESFPDYRNAVFSKLKKDNALFLDLTKNGYQSFSQILEGFPLVYKQIAINKLLAYEKALEQALSNVVHLIALLTDIDDAASKFKVVDSLLENEKIRGNVFGELGKVYQHLSLFYNNDIKQKIGEEWIIKKANVGIAHYLSTINEPSFTGKTTGTKQDQMQARVYDALLNEYAKTTLEKKIIIYALMENNHDKPLKDYVCLAMEMLRLTDKHIHHKDRVADIKHYLEAAIKKELEPLGITMMQVNASLVSKVNAYANSGKPIKPETCKSVMKHFQLLNENVGHVHR